MVGKKSQAHDFKRGVLPRHVRVTFFNFSFSVVMVGNADNWHRSSMVFYRSMQDQAS